MKICILTQPLYTNYGGLLQAYALQTVLKRMGHEVWTEDRRENRNNVFGILKNNARILLGPIRKFYYPTSSEKNTISKNTKLFVQKYINTTCPIYSTNKSLLNEYNFDAFIVGSDQVWRPMYSYGIYNYFLDFTKEYNVKRIAYAASFGTSEWEYTKSQTRICSSLIKKFDAVSVREESGVKLCKKYFGVDAQRVLDPTLLLEKKDYISLCSNEDEKYGVLTYFLDKNNEKECIASKIAKKLNLPKFSNMPQKLFYQVGGRNINNCIYPSVESWISNFKNASFVVTDSFHGTVFSILFNIPFITIANFERGFDRFETLFKIFNLKERLISSIDDLDIDILKHDIDYGRINSIIELEKEKSFQFLLGSLEKSN